MRIASARARVTRPALFSTFETRLPPNEIADCLEAAAEQSGYDVQRNDHRLSLSTPSLPSGCRVSVHCAPSTSGAIVEIGMDSTEGVASSIQLQHLTACAQILREAAHTASAAIKRA